MLVRTFEELDAWKAAHEFTLAVYRATSSFPKDERFGITSQLRRSTMSIPANLAEGFGRRSPKELARFARISDGSLQESKYFLILARDLSYIDSERFRRLKEQADRVGALLGGLQRHLSAKAAS